MEISTKNGREKLDILQKQLDGMDSTIRDIPNLEYKLMNCKKNNST